MSAGLRTTSFVPDRFSPAISRQRSGVARLEQGLAARARYSEHAILGTIFAFEIGAGGSTLDMTAWS